MDRARIYVDLNEMVTDDMSNSGETVKMKRCLNASFFQKRCSPKIQKVNE